MSVVQCPCPTPPWLLLSSLALVWEDHWWPTGTCAKLCNAYHTEKASKNQQRDPPKQIRMDYTTLHRRRQIAMVCQVHCCLQKQAPHYLCSKFITNSEFGYREPEMLTKLHLLRPNTNFYRKPSSFKERNAITIFSLPWDKSWTVLFSDLLWLLHVGTNLSVFTYLFTF